MNAVCPCAIVEPRTIAAVMEIVRISLQLPPSHGCVSTTIDMERGTFSLKAWSVLPYERVAPDFAQTVYLYADTGAGAQGCLSSFKSWITTDCRCEIPSPTTSGA